MRRVIPFMISLVLLLSLTACAVERDGGSGAVQNNDSENQQATDISETLVIPDEPEETMFYAHIGGNILEIKLERNSSSEAFLSLLAEGDITVDMHDYGIPREEIFVITKLYPNQFSDPEAAIEMALNKLDIGYIDMMLLHHPGTDDVC